jgi:DNA repair exonuclease SbcCD ATPase subunit
MVDTLACSNPETAIQARETSVETCKEKIGEVKTEMEVKLENLKQSIDRTKERTDRLEQAAESLSYRNDGVVGKIEVVIQDHRNDIEDATEKAGSISDIINLAGQIATAVSISASAIGQIVDALQGIFR